MLPKLELPIHFIELPVSKREIEIRPFVVKQEKSLITSLDPTKREEAIKVFEMLIKDCVITEDFNIKDLNIVDFFYLILQIRMKSTGETVEGQLKCEKCEKLTDFDINLEDSILIKNADTVENIIKINDKLSVRIIPSNIKIMFTKEDVDIIDVVASSIDTIIYKKKIYNYFTQKELKENILNFLTKKDYDIISKGMEKVARLYISFDYDCFHCGHINKYETDDVANFQ